jgi:hypothetical protein
MDRCYIQRLPISVARSVRLLPIRVSPPCGTNVYFINLPQARKFSNLPQARSRRQQHYPSNQSNATGPALVICLLELLDQAEHAARTVDDCFHFLALLELVAVIRVSC